MNRLPHAESALGGLTEHGRYNRHNRPFAKIVEANWRAVGSTGNRRSADGRIVPDMGPCSTSRQFEDLAKTAMNEISSEDRLQQLESRHVQLLEELDALDSRLEQTLQNLLHPSVNQPDE